MDSGQALGSEQDPGFAEFISVKPILEELRAKYATHPKILEVLHGTGFVKDKPNLYFSQSNGLTVASWEIEQGHLGDLRRNTTYGRFPQGVFLFPLGKYNERITVTDGELEINVNGSPIDLSPLRVAQSVVLPASSEVSFVVRKGQARYACEYAVDASVFFR